jgi:hypothetical protein
MLLTSLEPARAVLRKVFAILVDPRRRAVVKFSLAALPLAVTPRGNKCKDHAAAIPLKERGCRFLCQLSSYLCVIIIAGHEIGADVMQPSTK